MTPKDRAPAYAEEAALIKAQNRGHGYVYERADGMKGKIKYNGVATPCGGPERCLACRNDWRHRYGVAWPQKHEPLAESS